MFTALLAATVVFAVWYPYLYRNISGGREIFQLLVVVLVQLAALGYGLWTVFAARPVHRVFEIDRFRIVQAVDVPVELLGKEPDGVNPLPLSGPTLLTVRPHQITRR